MSNNSDKTVRPDVDEPIEKTVRPDVDEPIEKTVRPDVDEPIEKTTRPDQTMCADGMQADKTMRPDGDPFPKTVRPDQQQQQQPEDDATKHYLPEYELNKVKYRVVKVILKGGEGEVFLVEAQGKQYALKLYKPGIPLPQNILKIVKEVAGSGILVATFDYGMWINPQTQQQHGYELMEYCAGGSLNTLKINGDEKLMSEIALKCAIAINFMHNQQVLHRDVKPANFFLRNSDPKVDDLVLGDFGLCVQTDKNGNFVGHYFFDQGRTQIYASPETYGTIGGQITLNYKSDFFSLGVMLIVLMVGEAKLKIDERILMNWKNYGKLPYPENISDRLLELMKALTHPDPEERAGFDEVIRWAKGETIYELKSGKDDIAGFKIVFNSSKNQIAHSPEELAGFMVNDKALATKYLYQGTIEKWLTEILRNELATEIRDFTEKLYPQDQEAGFYATCYFLDSNLPYIDVKGKANDTPQDLAQSLISNFSHYNKALANKNDAAFLWLNAHGAEHITQEFAPKFKKTKSNRDALLQLIHTLDKTLPWTIVTDDNQTMACKTPDDVLRVRYEYGFSDESWSDLISESFLVWLNSKDSTAEGRIRSTKGHDKRQSAVLYNLNQEVSYNYQLDKSADNYYFKADQVGFYMNWMMQRYITDENDSYASAQLDTMCNIDDTRLYDYLKSKGGMYDDKIKWIKDCANTKSKENANKTGRYNWKTGVYKAIKGLGSNPYYYFPKSDKYVYTLDELNQIPSKEVKAELDKGYLEAWLTTFYHEDPFINLTPKFTYEKQMVKYIEHLERIDAKHTDVVNFNIGRKSVEKTVTKLKQKQRTHLLSKALIGVVTLLAAVAVILGLLGTHIPIDVEDHKGWISIAAGVVGVLAFLIMWGTADAGCLGNIIVGAIAGGIIFGILWFLVPFVGYIAAGLLLVLMVVWIVKSYVKYPPLIRANKHLLNPGFEERYFEPLAFAFSNDQYFKSSIGDKSSSYADYLSTGTKRFYKQLIMPWALIIGLGFLVYWASAMMGGWSPGAATTQSIKGEWAGKLDKTSATIVVNSTSGDAVNATLRIGSTNRKLTGTNEENSLTLKPETTGGDYSGSWTGTVTDGVFTGNYTNPNTGARLPFTLENESVKKEIEAAKEKAAKEAAEAKEKAEAKKQKEEAEAAEAKKKEEAETNSQQQTQAEPEPAAATTPHATGLLNDEDMKVDVQSETSVIERVFTPRPRATQNGARRSLFLDRIHINESASGGVKTGTFTMFLTGSATGTASAGDYKPFYNNLNSVVLTNTDNPSQTWKPVTKSLNGGVASIVFENVTGNRFSLRGANNYILNGITIKQ